LFLSFIIYQNQTLENPTLAKNVSQCSKCRGAKKYNFSWLPAIIIAFLPKCPLCIMAYSGAVSMCTGTKYFPNADVYSGYIIVSLSLVVLLGIFLNRKGLRTWIAASIASVGILLLTISQFIYLSESLYYLASATLFFGIWFNGSFGYFYKKYFKHNRYSPIHSKFN